MSNKMFIIKITLGDLKDYYNGILYEEGTQRATGLDLVDKLPYVDDRYMFAKKREAEKEVLKIKKAEHILLYFKNNRYYKRNVEIVETHIIEVSGWGDGEKDKDSRKGYREMERLIKNGYKIRNTECGDPHYDFKVVIEK